MSRTVKDEHTYEYDIQHQCKGGVRGTCPDHLYDGGWYTKTTLRNVQRDQARTAFEDVVREAPRSTYRLVERVVLHKVTEETMEHHDGISREDYESLDPKHYHHEGCYQNGCMLRAGESVT